MSAAAQQLAGHIQRAVDGPMWHGPALAEILAGVSPEKAAARPVPGAHSIAFILAAVTWIWIPETRGTVLE